MDAGQRETGSVRRQAGVKIHKIDLQSGGNFGIIQTQKEGGRSFGHTQICGGLPGIDSDFAGAVRTGSLHRHCESVGVFKAKSKDIYYVCVGEWVDLEGVGLEN